MSNLLQLPEQSALTLASPPSVLAIANHPISFQQALQSLRNSGKLSLFLEEIATQYLLEQEFQQRSDLEIQASAIEEAIVTFQQQNGLTELRNFQSWLKSKGWDESIFREQIALNLKLEKFKVQLAQPQLLQHFIENKLLLDQVVLSRIVVASQDLAEELKIQIVEESGSFEGLAQTYSQSEDGATNGMMGAVSRLQIQQTIAIDVYAAEVGEIIGPIACDGDCWCLIRVEKMLPATLDYATAQQLQDEIFQQWLSNKMQSLVIDLCLSEPIHSADQFI
ncbi:MAG: peptidylprolyl isomerase [Timaviella obliquedivisa GSE-PSE-MK23-08B]|jgi:hypothetical protein|nr:peptidylprolyl isomerase [Timaviella obliquedivisa GSE-PSE-MK23-08B]